MIGKVIPIIHIQSWVNNKESKPFPTLNITRSPAITNLDNPRILYQHMASQMADLSISSMLSLMVANFITKKMAATVATTSLSPITMISL